MLMLVAYRRCNTRVPSSKDQQQLLLFEFDPWEPYIHWIAVANGLVPYLAIEHNDH